MSCEVVVKYSQKGIAYHAWENVPTNRIVSLDTTSYEVWLAGKKRSEVWKIRALYEGEQPMWPLPGAEIESLRSGQIRYVHFDQIQIHPVALRKMRAAKKIAKQQKQLSKAKKKKK